MGNFNRVYLLGRLTRDPEVRYTPKGTPVADTAIAVNRSYKGEDGAKKEDVTFVDVTLWGRQAEVAQEYLAKGRQIFIEGRLQLDIWDDRQTGQKRSRLRVVCENLQMLGARPEGTAEAGHSNAPSSPPPPKNDFDEADIPY